MVADFQCLSREAHTTFHVVFPAVHRTPLHLAELGRNGLDIVATHLNGMIVETVLLQGRHAVQIGWHIHVVHVQFLAHTVIVGILPVIGNGVSSRIVEDNDIVQCDLLGTDTLIVPLHTLNITLADAHRQGMLAQGSMQGCLRHTWTIGHLAYEQIVAHQQTLLERTGRYGVVLEEVDIDKINRHQCKHDGIYPGHDGAQDGVFQIFPPAPVNLPGNVGIKDEGQHYYAPPGLYPHKEGNVQSTYHESLYPVNLFWLVFLHYPICIRI